MIAMVDFMVRLKRIDNAGHNVRDVLILWAIKKEPGLMGRELAIKLGYKTRSNVQIRLRHLLDNGLLADHRIKKNNLTPNDLHITPAGEKFLDSVVPA